MLYTTEIKSISNLSAIFIYYPGKIAEMVLKKSYRQALLFDAKYPCCQNSIDKQKQPPYTSIQQKQYVIKAG